MTAPKCGDVDPEAYAGEPVDDGWEKPAIQDDEEVTDGELDPGALPGQPA